MTDCALQFLSVADQESVNLPSETVSSEDDPRRSLKIEMCHGQNQAAGVPDPTKSD